MTDPYDKYADIFMASMAGQNSGLTKDQFILLCKKKFPIESEFVKTMDELTKNIEAKIQQSQFTGDQSFGSPYSVNGSNHHMH